nr:FK506-binding protein 5-like [Ipomoea batatas]
MLTKRNKSEYMLTCGNCSEPLLTSSIPDLKFYPFSIKLYGPYLEINALAREESKLEKEIIRTIHSGNTESLKPNSGQAVTIGEHHICVGFHEDEDSDYRVWEWHGHIILFDDENGYNPEYIYGNYFERLAAKTAMKKKQGEEKQAEKEVEKVGNMGLRELIESAESNSEARILRRNINAGSQNFIPGTLSLLNEAERVGR